MIASLAELKQPDTAQRILDAAESLFVDHGFEATSTRMITQAAQVNLAAVNYHFGSKEGLLQAVFERRLTPLNLARLRDLDELERVHAPHPVPVDALLFAFIGKSILAQHQGDGEGRRFVRLLSRAFIEPHPTLQLLLPAQYAPLIERFKAAFRHACPDLPEEDLLWRLYFCFGAIAHALTGNDALRLVAPCPQVNLNDTSLVVQHLIPFLAAALTAPLLVSLPPVEGVAP